MAQNLFLDEIMAIEDVGEREVFDIVMPNTHCYFANGILVHNSGDLEQDADNVIGIYRENKESEVMELGGLKGRDVGTWQCEVTFDRYTQRIR
jgi:hypothetical protein